MSALGNSATGERARERYDVAVVGADQAGLAIGYYLARQGRRFVVLESADWIGVAWRDRWDSLVLFTPRRYDSLPGLPFPGDPDGYPTRDEVIAYLELYAATFELPIELNSAVRSVTSKNGVFVLALDDMRLDAEQVVVATGPFQNPRVPAFAGQLAPQDFQVHSTGYRTPNEIPEGTVLIVGGGNTGYQITAELSATHRVHLSVGSRQTPLPQRLLGQDLFWWLDKTRLLSKTVESRLGRRMRTCDALIGSSPRALKRHDVDLKPRVTGISGSTIRFADGNELEVDAVIWATGYELDHTWIKPAAVDEAGHVRHRRGVTETRGLYFLGLPWQYTRGSALLGWVKDDAAYIAEQIEALRAGATNANAVTDPERAHS